EGLAVGGSVEWVHVQLGGADEEPRTGERDLVVLVVTDDVADVLAEKALDALAELLRALDVHLLHPVPTGCEPRRRGERRQLASLLVVEGHVRDEVADHREGTDRRDRDRPRARERRHAGQAAPPRLAVDPHRTRAALAGLAVPPHGEVGGLGRLKTVDHIQDYLAVVDLDLVVLELAAGVVAAPD